MNREIEVWADWRELGSPVPLGQLRSSLSRGKEVFSFTYQIAKVKSVDQVALETGNSPDIIFKHYRELATEEQADEWFGIVPKEGQWENTCQWDYRTRTVTLPAQPES
jgi:hypothetical protein